MHYYAVDGCTGEAEVETMISDEESNENPAETTAFYTELAKHLP